MNNDTRMTDAVDGYRVLATELVTKWGDLASAIADKIDADEYDGKAMFDAWAKATRLTGGDQFPDVARGTRRRDDPVRPSVRARQASTPTRSRARCPARRSSWMGRWSGLARRRTPARRGAPVASSQTVRRPSSCTRTRRTSRGDAYMGTVLASRGGQTEPVEVFITVA